MNELIREMERKGFKLISEGYYTVFSDPATDELIYLRDERDMQGFLLELEKPKPAPRRKMFKGI